MVSYLDNGSQDALLEDQQHCPGVENDSPVIRGGVVFERRAGNVQVGAIYANSSHIHPIHGISVRQNRRVHQRQSIGGRVWGRHSQQQRGSQSGCSTEGNETIRKHIVYGEFSELAGE